MNKHFYTWFATVACLFSSCTENCDFEQAPNSDIIDCGFQAPFEQFSEWTYLDTITGDTITLKLEARIDTFTSTECDFFPERWYRFEQNQIGIDFIFFDKSTIAFFFLKPSGRPTGTSLTTNMDCGRFEQSDPDLEFRESYTIKGYNFTNVYLLTTIGGGTERQIAFTRTKGMIYLAVNGGSRPDYALVNISAN